MRQITRRPQAHQYANTFPMHIYIYMCFCRLHMHIFQRKERTALHAYFFRYCVHVYMYVCILWMHACMRECVHVCTYNTRQWFVTHAWQACEESKKRRKENNAHGNRRGVCVDGMYGWIHWATWYILGFESRTIFSCQFCINVCTQQRVYAWMAVTCHKSRRSARRMYGRI